MLELIGVIILTALISWIVETSADTILNWLKEKRKNADDSKLIREGQDESK